MSRDSPDVSRDYSSQWESCTSRCGDFDDFINDDEDGLYQTLTHRR